MKRQDINLLHPDKMVGVLLIERPLLVCDVAHIGEHAGDHLEYIVANVYLEICDPDPPPCLCTSDPSLGP